MGWTELENLLQQACDNVNEGEQDIQGINRFPAILYWPFILASANASGETYHYVATYQVSLLDKFPPRRSPTLRNLDALLRQFKGISGEWRMEYSAEEKIWHSAISIDIEVDENEFFALGEHGENIGN